MRECVLGARKGLGPEKEETGPCKQEIEGTIKRSEYRHARFHR